MAEKDFSWDGKHVLGSAIAGQSLECSLSIIGTRMLLTVTWTFAGHDQSPAPPYHNTPTRSILFEQELLRRRAVGHRGMTGGVHPFIGHDTDSNRMNSVGEYKYKRHSSWGTHQLHSHTMRFISSALVAVGMCATVFKPTVAVNPGNNSLHINATDNFEVAILKEFGQDVFDGLASQSCNLNALPRAAVFLALLAALERPTSARASTVSRRQSLISSTSLVSVVEPGFAYAE
ncbi:hypothetical protein AB1N83_006077 [Pleurotus pulmonarius]